MLTALERIDTPYVMYFQEDYWIQEPVDTARMQSYVELMEKKNLNYIRLLSFPQPDYDYPEDPRLGLIARNGPYRTSVQISFWRREVFRDLIVPGESVWQFEINGTQRSRGLGDTFLSTKRVAKDDYYNGIRYLCTAVNAGKWFRPAWDYARKEDLDLDFSGRPTESIWEHYQRTTWWGRAAGIAAYRASMLVRDPAEASRKLRRRLTITRAK
jgi:hypothetical protein